METIDLEALKLYVNLEEVLAYYRIPFKREGSNKVALCLWHDEKSPSMVLHPGRGSEPSHLFCHGCRTRGTILDVVMNQEGISDIVAAAKRLIEIFPHAQSLVVKESDHKALPDRITNPQSARREIRQAPEPTPKKTVELPELILKEDEYDEPVDVKAYRYRNADGTLRFEVLRRHCYHKSGDGRYKKRWAQRRPHADGSYIWGLEADRYVRFSQGWFRFKPREHAKHESKAVEIPECERILYNLPEVRSHQEICLVEGEKDADTLFAIGFVATTANGGANAPWLDSFTEEFRGKIVYHFYDRDKKAEDPKKKGEVGQAFAGRVQEQIQSVAQSYIRIHLPLEYKDITDFLESKGDDPDVRRAYVNELISEREFTQAREEAKRIGFIGAGMIATLFPGGPNAFLDTRRREPGLLTGIDDFDKKTLGLLGKQLFILAGRPAMGKTALALKMAMNIARSSSKAVLIVSREMSRASLLERCICALARVNMQAFRSGALDDADRRALSDAFIHLCELPILIDDEACRSISDVHERIQELKYQHDIGAVVVDYIQLMHGDGKKGSNRQEEVSSISRDSKLLATENDLPVIGLSQLSRAPEQRTGNHRPMLSDLRESGSLEQDADLVGFVFREEVYRPDKQFLRGRGELILAKQRNGPTGTCRLTFLHELATFENGLWSFDENSDEKLEQAA